MVVMTSDIDKVANAAYAVGLRGDSLITAIAIAGAESGYRLGAHGDVSIGGSYGPWQVYIPAHPEYSPEWLTESYLNNAQAMFQISGGGSNWNPWTTFFEGTYRKFLDEATEAAARATGETDGGTAGGTTYAPRPDNLSEPFGSRLDALLAAFGGRVWINSGYRSIEEQTILWENSDKSGIMVGAPGSSKHNFGMAADLGWDTDATIAEVHAVARDYGLWFPMDYENWHIEPIGSRDGTYVEEVTAEGKVVGSGVKGIKGLPIPGIGNPIEPILDTVNKVTGWFSFKNVLRIGQFFAGSILFLFGLGVLLRKPALTVIGDVKGLAT